MADRNNPRLDGSEGEQDESKEGGKASGKSRRELPPGAVATLKAWLLSPEHFTHPYPTPQDQEILMQKTGIEKKQLKNWFTNARRRIWKPMLKKQLERGKLGEAGTGDGVAGGSAVTGLVVQTFSEGIPYDSENHISPNVPMTMDNPHSVKSVPTKQFQQSMQQQESRKADYDTYTSASYSHQVAMQQATADSPESASESALQYGNPQFYHPHQCSHQLGKSQATGTVPVSSPIAASNSIGSLPPIGTSPSSAAHSQMNKNDSHAVLMELFTRDQDLVRQATESAKLRVTANTAGGELQQDQPLSSHHPVKPSSQGSRLSTVPTLNSWPRFSSISSLNNLGPMTGVKSITSLSGADLASQGNLNRMGNLAQVKSIENMGRNDSYAFLEVFFGDRSASGLALGAKEQRGVKRERDEDDDVGLYLDGDESPSIPTVKSGDVEGLGGAPAPTAYSSQPAPVAAENVNKDRKDDSGTLKRAYDDALAARGLISVSRSCEKLTDLALPAKLQRTLSQEYLRQQHIVSSHYGQQSCSVSSLPRSEDPPARQQSSGQHPSQNQLKASAAANGEKDCKLSSMGCHRKPSAVAVISDSSRATSVEVPSATKCALCHCTNVDTQLRPCGHMFHEKCLKPTLQAAIRQPKCPVDRIPMQSALLAVPSEDHRTWGSTSSPIPPPPAVALSAEASRSKA